MNVYYDSSIEHESTTTDAISNEPTDPVTETITANIEGKFSFSIKYLYHFLQLKASKNNQAFFMKKVFKF